MSSFARQIKKFAGNFLKKQGDKFSHKHFSVVKEYIISEVRKHPVCVELKNHTNPSKFMNGLSSRGGTLFGLMGFNEDDDPVENLIEFLEKKITRRTKLLSFFFRSKVFFPDLSDMAKEENLQMPWLSGISWPQAVQDGISGLRNFLAFTPANAPSSSRSQEGLQAKDRKGHLINVRDADMPPISFLDDIFEKAKRIRIKGKLGQDFK